MLELSLRLYQRRKKHTHNSSNDSQKWMSNYSGWVYVVLSRVTKGNDVYLTVPLSTKLSIYKERSDIKNEMNRLRRVLVNPTKALLQSFQNNNGREDVKLPNRLREMTLSTIPPSDADDAKFVKLPNRLREMTLSTIPPSDADDAKVPARLREMSLSTISPACQSSESR